MDSKNWMTQLHGKIKHIKLGDLPLLGTHNAAMNRKSSPKPLDLFMTQYYKMNEQFELGCRYFEIRPYHISGQSYYRGYHGIQINDNNAKDELKRISKIIGGKELVILDMERSVDLTRKNFIKDMKGYFKNKIIYPGDFGGRRLRDLTIRELTDKGNVILMTAGFSGSDMWDRDKELESTFKITKSDNQQKLKENIIRSISTPPSEVNGKLWIHDAYLTSNTSKVFNLRDAANKTTQNLNGTFLELKKKQHRVNIIKVDYFGVNQSNQIFKNMYASLAR